MSDPGTTGITIEHQASVDYRVVASADIDDGVTIGAGSSVWHLAHLRAGAVLGRDCVIGRGAYIGTGVRLGDNVKVQNHALVYEPATLGDGVFVGPAVVFTNDHRPRAVTPDGRLKRAEDWEAVGVDVADGASIGARAVCVAPVRIGRWAMVGAGSVVTRDVPDFALVLGVPARQVGWVGRAGEKLVPLAGDTATGEAGDANQAGAKQWQCPVTGATYQEENGMLRELRS